MKIGEYEQMMSWLTRPAVNRTGFSQGTKSLSEEYYGKDKLDWMKNFSDQMSFEDYLRWKRSGSFAQGGRIGFSKGGDFRIALENLIKNKDTSFNTMQQIFDKTNTPRTANLETIFNKEFKNKFKFDTSFSKKLNPEELKIVLEWGKNKGKGKWSKKKILEAYDNSDPTTRMRIRLKENKGLAGGNIKGSVKALTTEQQKLWNKLNPDLKWEDYTGNRGNWIYDYSRKKDIFDKTKGLLTEDELAEYLGKKLGQDISKTKIYGRFGQGKKTALATYLDNNLFVDSYGSIRSTGTGGGKLRYFKKPTETQINQIKKQNLTGDIRVNTLKQSTYDNIVKLNSKFKDLYYQGKVPKIEDVLAEFPKMGKQEAGTATSKLAQIYNGHKFRNNPPGIRVNKIAAKKLQETLEKFPFGHPYRAGQYFSALQTIDEGLGQSTGTFDNLKRKAKEILKENGIKVYDPSKGKKAFGFNIDEFAGVTGTARTKNMAVSQFINVLEGGLNTKTLSGFQSQLSTARQAVEAAKAKGPEAYRKEIKIQMKKINTRAIGLEEKHGIKLARLERPADINNMSKDEVRRLKNIKLGTGENLYERLVKDAKASGYSIKFPEGAQTIQEFTDPANRKDLDKKLLTLKNSILTENAIKEGITVCTKGGGKVSSTKQMINTGGRVGYGKKCYSGQALMDFVRENPEEAMKAFKASKEVNASMAKNPSKWLKAGRMTLRELGPLGIIGGEIFLGGALTALELGQGKDVWEAMDNGFLYGLAGVEEKNLLKYADTFNLSDEEKKYFKTALDVSKKAPAYVKILDTMSNMDPTKLTTTEPGARGMGEGRERPTAYARYKTLADKKLAEINALKGDLTKDQFLKGNIFLEGLGLAKEYDETQLKAERKAATEQAMQNIEAYNQFDFDPWSAAEGGRAGFDEGSKPKSPGRRAFIKGLGALAVLPIVGKFFKMSDVVNRPKLYTGPAIGKTKGMPEWFPGLVKKLWNEGDDVTKQASTAERQIVKRGTLESGDDVDLIYDAGTGDVSIQVVPKKGEFSTKSGAYEKSYGLEYKKGQADEMTKGTPADEFGAYEARPYRTGKNDVDLDFDEVDVDDIMSDLQELENFSKKK